MRKKLMTKSILYALTAGLVLSTGHIYKAYADGSSVVPLINSGSNVSSQAASNNSSNSNNNTSVAQASSILNNTNILGNQLTYDNFISTISPIAQQIANSNNLYPSLMVAQAALESGYGQSTLTQQSNNLFGIKSTNGQGYNTTTGEYGSNGYYVTNSTFASYPTLMDSLQGYATFLIQNSRYANVFRSQATDGIQAAKNIQADGYATDPAYATKLINVINQYNLLSLDGNGTGTTTNTNTTNNTTNNTANKKPAAKVLATANYTGGNTNETVQLSSNFNKYKLYTHVKDTRKKNTTAAWENSAAAGSTVYVDCLAVRTYKGAATTWYRISFSKNGTKYWVYSSALNFPLVNYSNDSNKVKIKGDYRQLYSNVFGTPQLSKRVSKTTGMKGMEYSIQEVATSTVNGTTNTWYQISVGQLGNVWINQVDVTYVSATQKNTDTTKKDTSKTTNKKTVKKTTTKTAAKKTAVKKTNKPAQYFKYSGYGYLNHYGKYDLNNHIPGSYKNVKKISWSQVKVPKDFKVEINCKGIRTKYNTTWYRIVLNNKSYWISGKALLFY